MALLATIMPYGCLSLGSADTRETYVGFHRLDENNQQCLECRSRVSSLVLSVAERFQESKNLMTGLSVRCMFVELTSDVDED